MLKLQNDFILARNDHKKLINLCIKFLGGKIFFDFRTPGALHKACWMAKFLYSFKICLLQFVIEELPPGIQLITTTVQLTKLKRFIILSALIYCQWWFLSTSAADAPYNDLMSLKSVMEYDEVDKLMSNNADKTFLRHLYIVPEIVSFSLFSSVVSTNERRKLEKKLLLFQPFQPVVCSTPVLTQVLKNLTFLQCG